MSETGLYSDRAGGRNRVSLRKYGGSSKKYRRNPVSYMVADGGDRIHNVGARHQQVIGEDEKVSIAVPRHQQMIGEDEKEIIAVPRQSAGYRLR